MANLAELYPNLIIYDRTGTLYYQMRNDGKLVHRLRRIRTRTLLEPLNESDNGDPARRRLFQLLQNFCPDSFVALVVQLVNIYEPSLLVAEYIFMSRPFPLIRGNVIKLIDTHDVFSSKGRKIEQYGISDGLALSQTQEAELLRRSDVLLAIQPDEARELSRLAPDQKVLTVGVDFPVLKATDDLPTDATVLLVGSDNQPNVTGLNDFLQFCWPSITQEIPGAMLLIAGRVGNFVSQPHENVCVLGVVNDLSSIYQKARIVINPAIAGTGLKIKTIEALCHLRPVVCWPSGADGIAEDARVFCHQAKDWRNFADKVIHLLKVDTDAFAIGKEYATLRRIFSPEIVYAPLTEFFGRHRKTNGSMKSNPGCLACFTSEPSP